MAMTSGMTPEVHPPGSAIRAARPTSVRLMSNVAPPQLPITSWQVPLIDGETIHIDAVPGEAITIVGANGSGKSALATWMARQVPHNKRRRVLAQRRVWLQSSGPNISASGRETLATNLQHWDTASDSRFLDHADGQRTDIALFDLLGKIAAEDHQIAELSQTDRRRPEEIDTIVGERLFDILNSVLDRAGLIVHVKMTDKQTFAAVHRDLGNEYPIAQMSDGERSALLLAAEVLVAPDDSVVMLDEPERHLHRSISAGLIEALVDARTDCSFVILTHDLDLALSMSARPGKVLAAIGMEWSENDAVRWALEEITTDAPLTESARRGILGGRTRVLFIEGTDDSLDYSLYRVLFPTWTLAPSGNCEWVIRSVEGVRNTDSHHWIQAAGIVDGDGRSKEEREALMLKGIYPLTVSEVESLYYLPAVLTAVAAKLADLDGESADERVRKAKAAGIAALAANDGLERIAKKLATDAVSRALVAALPSEVTNPDIRISLPSPYAQFKERLNDLHAKGDYEELVRIASIRDSGFRNKVAKALGFDHSARYQKTAHVAIAESPELTALLRSEVADQLVEG